MKKTQIKVPFYYIANVIYPNKRKSVPVMVEDSIVVNINEFTQEEVPVAFKAKGRDLPFTKRNDVHYDGKRLWIISRERKHENGSYVYDENNNLVLEHTTVDEIKRMTENKGEGYPYSGASRKAPFFNQWWDAKIALEDKKVLYAKKSLEKEIRIWESDNRKDIIKQIKDIAKNMISIDGVICEPSGEPRYVVMTFGLGNNHGGTSLSQDTYYNGNISKKCYFNANQYEEALASAIKTANGRGDNESIERIKSEINKIVVLIPEAVKLNPNKDHGNGSQFLNDIEEGIQSMGALGGLVMATSHINK